MMRDPNILVFSIFITLSLAFCAYLAILEWFKAKRAQYEPGLNDDPRTRRRKTIACAHAAVVLLLFFLGFHFLPLQRHSLFFVLYWWGTFTLALCLFLFPTLDFLNTIQNQTEKAAEQKHVIVQMVHSLHELSKPEKTGLPNNPTNDDPHKPPTYH